MIEFSGPYKIEEVILLESGVTHYLVFDGQGTPLIESYDKETAEEVVSRLEEYEKLLDLAVVH